MSTADERIAHLERQVERLLAEIVVLKAENAELRHVSGSFGSGSRSASSPAT